MELSTDNNGDPIRLYKVGLRWDIAPHHRNAINFAYDIYRDGQQLTTERPITPARGEREPSTISANNNSNIIQQSLPAIPPFSQPQEIRPAEFQYVDVEARLGSVSYYVESVDIHGMYSEDRKSHSHQVEATVPVPVPNDLRAEIKKLGEDEYNVVTRWEVSDTIPNIQSRHYPEYARILEHKLS